MILCVTHKSPLENGPFIQQVHPNKRQEASSQSAARIQALWIMDALYALSDTYLHFPQDCTDERGQGFRLETERGGIKKAFFKKQGEKRKRLRMEIK